MAGYMSVPFNYVYNTITVPSAELTNGCIVDQDGAAATKSTMTVKCVAVREDGYEFEVTGIAATDRLYFLENENDINDSVAYDTAEISTLDMVDNLNRAHMLHLGERFVVGGTALNATTCAVGSTGSLDAGKIKIA